MNTVRIFALVCSDVTRVCRRSHLLHDVSQFTESFLWKTLEGGNTAETVHFSDSVSKISLLCSVCERNEPIVTVTLLKLSVCSEAGNRDCLSGI